MQFLTTIQSRMTRIKKYMAHFILLGPFDEMKGWSLTLAKRQLYIKNEFHAQFLKSHKMVLSKVWQGINIYLSVFLTIIKHLIFNSLKLGYSNNTWTLLKHHKLSKVMQISLPKHEFLGNFTDDTNVNWNFSI